MTFLVDGATGWAVFAGLVLTTGAVTARWLLVPRAGILVGESAERMLREAARLGMGGAALLVGGLGLFFARQLVEFRDPFSPCGEEAALLISPAWGRTWVRAGIAGVLLPLAFAAAARHSAGWWLASPLTLALGLFPAMTGHASAQESFTVLFILADAIHVWAAGAGIGGLAAILWIERQTRRQAPGSSALPSLVPAFSPIAMGSVAALFVTGAVASWAHLPSVAAFFAPGWGGVLAVKLVLVAGVLALGARNFRVLTPRLGSEDGDDAMRRSALTELVLAQVVLIVTAILVRTSPMDG